ncbi:30S ribosomal protein S17 [Ureaplasma parvum]|uniref:Small ribosomal subunit protein uS17 n=6 Tax=Ureaplasma TaxID=2129 RepID=RS17_UREPA|nr:MULTISPECIES: 30S ribosomal protein S17 [Ureaplasma]B1AIM9.1 RecName: Full=Small ribosomal subunit protein uS17; AltName: Full=30S ribosomal protein S17 [Ureaplasma parvum serovar 3 str. ATCC 27815]B5ZB49.1 RecName: Full=Small ribosomal subunit protein uS17; AltName: Full=30S ribosomal protein S17 [Ureaplasma urealyticum serovar 10 str. ATCC 33699]Q9PQQ1.1 RecName: Full=Small ribosomal subunit protein uS17; AltName: Full=30S ribosomal protein S17 [Ureaplasma parvum serovar 3 str. ATCC 700970]
MERSRRKVLEGLVVSDKMQKTVVVSVETKSKHPIYRKLVISHKKYHAHNDNDDAKVGDLVEITETRPLSATKNWRVSKILERAR